MALEPYDNGLIGTTLRYPYEVRHATDYFGEIPDLTPAPELLRLAAHILGADRSAAGCWQPWHHLVSRHSRTHGSRHRQP
jgi:non-homologous end joining protein Ku